MKGSRDRGSKKILRKNHQNASRRGGNDPPRRRNTAGHYRGGRILLFKRKSRQGSLPLASNLPKIGRIFINQTPHRAQKRQETHQGLASHRFLPQKVCQTSIKRRG